MSKKLAIVIGCIVAIVLIVLAVFLTRVPKYEITFTSDNEVYETLTVKEDGTIEEPNKPTKEGYSFVGWYVDGEKFDFSTKVTKDMELVAKWVKVDAILYTITFNTNGGEDVKSIEVDKNKAIGTLPIPEKKGYKFIGWYVGDKEITKTTIATKDLNLIAKWEKEDKTTTRRRTTKATTTTTTTTTVPQTVATTTTTTTTTTTKVVKDEVVYIFEDIKDGEIASAAGQVRLFLIKNGKKVSGTCDIVTTDGQIITKSIDKSGYVTNRGLIKTVKNIKVN